MKVFLCNRKDLPGWEECYSAIIVADTEEEANGMAKGLVDGSDWLCLIVAEKAKDGIPRGVLLEATTIG